MNFFQLFILFFLYYSEKIFCFSEWWENSKVVELTNDNFFSHVGGDKYIVVKFYTKWCFYCKKLAPIYEDLHEFIESNRKDIIVARIEGDINNKISQLYDIHSFPKICMFYPKSIDIDKVFKGRRTKEYLIEWINAKAPDLSQYMNPEGKLSLELLEEEDKIVNKLSESELNTNSNKNSENSIVTITNDQLEYMKEEIKLLHLSIDKVDKSFNEINDNISTKGYFVLFSFETVVFLLIIMVILSAIMTFCKIYSKL